MVLMKIIVNTANMSFFLKTEYEILYIIRPPFTRIKCKGKGSEGDYLVVESHLKGFKELRKKKFGYRGRTEHMYLSPFTPEKLQ